MSEQASSETATGPVSDLTGLLGGLDDDYYNDDEWDCTHCGGTGYREVDDPLWDDCDEFGEGPCASCLGTGLRKHQTVF